MKVANAAFKTKVSKKTSSEERTNARMGVGSFARSESLSSKEACLQTIAPSFAGLFARSETPSSRKKAEIQYGKFWRIPCPPMTAYREGWLGRQDILES
jgi:hypothetical protein